MTTIRWSDLCSRGTALHVSYASQPTGGSWRLHGHDFCEVFWVDSGIGVHYVGLSGEPHRLVSGQCCFIRERDCHGFAATEASEPFACINIAFPTRAWAELRDRYALQKHPFLDDAAPVPPILEAPTELRLEFASLFHRTLRRPADALSRDLFLLSLADRTGGWHLPATPEKVPGWLRRGMMAMENNPESWVGGSSKLAHYCGCSRTHLARIFRQHFERRPSEWVAELRLARASRLLIDTTLSVTDVALESGFENLSHFHRCFAKRFGRTPLQYRKALQRTAFG